MDGHNLYIFSFGIKEQLPLVLENVNEVNREHSRLTAASSVYDSTKHNGPITIYTKGCLFEASNKRHGGIQINLNSNKVEIQVS